MPRLRLRHVVLGLLVGVLAVGVWLGVRGWLAQGHLTQAQAGVADLQEQALAGDIDSAAQTLTQVQDDTGSARSLTSDPVWRAAHLLPYLGDDLRAVTSLSTEVDRLATGVLPVVESARALDPAALQPRDGAIDLAPLAQAAPLLESASASLETSRAAVADIETAGLLGPVRDAHAQLLGQLEDAQSVLRPVAQATALAPGMLGADGPRTYMVLFQNNAEVRTTGGIVGAYAVLRADTGRLEMIEQETVSAGLGTFAEPVLELPTGVEALFDQRPALFPSAVNLTADWALSAELAQEMYRLRTGVTVDGVASVDPVALSYLLGATGPVVLPTGNTLDDQEVVPFLLSEAYRLIAADPEGQDEASAAVARAAFEAVVSGQGDPRETLEALDRGVDEGRLLLWSADPAEQQILASTALAGPLRPAGTGGDPDAAQEGDPVLGVFLNSAMAGKMDYYLRQEVALSAPLCQQGGSVQRTLDVILTSTAPADAATTLPEYVTGTTRIVPRGHNRTQVVFYAPPGGSFGQVRRDGEQIPFGSAQDAGHPAALATAELAPGQTVTVSVDMFLPAASADVPPVLRTTPTVQGAAVEVESRDVAEQLPACPS